MPKMQGYSQVQKDAILRQAQAFWERADNTMSSFFTHVNELERMSRGLLPADLDAKYAEYPDRSCLVPPDIYNNVNQMRAKARMLFAKKPYLRLFYAGQPTVRDERIHKAEQKVQQTFDMAGDGTGFVREADKANAQMFSVGLCCGVTNWRREYAPRPRRDSQHNILVGDDGYPIFDQQLIAEYPETTSADIRRVRVDPSAAEWKYVRIVGFQHIQMLSELRRFNTEPNNHYNFDEAKLRRSTFNREKYFEYTGYESKASDKGELSDYYGDQPVEVWSIRGIFRVPIEGTDDWEAVDMLVEIGNRQELLAAKKNDLPLNSWELFTFGAIDEYHSRLYAMGIIEPARDSFIEMFIKRNQSLDSANRNTYNTYIGDASACDKLPEYIESSSDQLLKIDVMGANMQSVNQALQVLNRPQLGQDTFQHALVLGREVQQTMRLSDYMQAKDPNSPETATGVAALTTSGAELTEWTLQRMVDTYYGPIGIKHLTLWNFFKGDVQETVVGSDGGTYEIMPGDLDIPVNATIEGSLSATQPGLIRRFIEAFPLIANDPYFDPRAVRQTLVDMLELPNGDRLLPPDDLMEMQVDRENVALGYGIELPVHPMDNHQRHLQGHDQYLQWITEKGEEVAATQGLSTEALVTHMNAHALEVEKMQASLGNTKDMGGLTGTQGGNQVTPAAATQRPGAAPTNAAATGAYTPAEGRS